MSSNDRKLPTYRIGDCVNCEFGVAAASVSEGHSRLTPRSTGRASYVKGTVVRVSLSLDADLY